MARILSQIPRREKTCVCNNCGHTVAYVPKDVQRYEGVDYSGGPDGCEYLICPGCSKRIVLRSW